MQKKIAYVKDDKSVANLITRILEREGIACLVCDKPQELGDLDEHIDLIISDGFIHNYTAFDVLMLRNKMFPKTPFFVYSGKQELLDEFVELGYDTLLKGGRPEIFIEKVKRYMS